MTVYEDPDAAHQIVLRYYGGGYHRIAVSCTCLRAGNNGCTPLAVAVRLPAAAALSAWREHLARLESRR